MKARTPMSAAFTVALFLTNATAARAQGLLAGTVDFRHRPIVGAVVSIQNKATQVRTEVVTDAWGQYRIANLVPGEYRLTVARETFETAIRDDVSVLQGRPTIVNVQMWPVEPCVADPRLCNDLTIVVRGRSPDSTFDPCSGEPTTRCMSTRDVAATISPPFKRLWIGDSASSQQSSWQSLPCESITASTSGGMLFIPGGRYTVTLSRGGRADLTSEDERDKDVRYEGEVPEVLFGRLCLLAERLGFDQLVNRYATGSSDSTGATISMTVDGRRHEVAADSESAPVEFWAMRTAIDTVKRRIDWKRK